MGRIVSIQKTAMSAAVKMDTSKRSLQMITDIQRWPASKRESRFDLISTRFGGGKRRNKGSKGRKKSRSNFHLHFI